MEKSKQTTDACWKWVQLAVVGGVFALGLWQFYAVGFDWRAILDRTSLGGFLIAMSTLPVFGFPISACYIYAGLAFPPLQASAVCVAALAINMSISYALTHTVLKAPLARFLRNRKWSIPEMDDYNQFRFTFLVRTVPGPPFFVQNLALGLAGIPFWTYLWVSLLAQGGIGIGVILCSRYLSEDPWGKGGLTVIAILTALVVAKIIRWASSRRGRAGRP